MQTAPHKIILLLKDLGAARIGKRFAPGLFSDSSTQNASFTRLHLRMGRQAWKDFAGFHPLGPLWAASGPAAAGWSPDAQERIHRISQRTQIVRLKTYIFQLPFPSRMGSRIEISGHPSEHPAQNCATVFLYFHKIRKIADESPNLLRNSPKLLRNSSPKTYKGGNIWDEWGRRGTIWADIE